MDPILFMGIENVDDISGSEDEPQPAVAACTKNPTGRYRSVCRIGVFRGVGAQVRKGGGGLVRSRIVAQAIMRTAQVWVGRRIGVKVHLRMEGGAARVGA